MENKKKYACISLSGGMDSSTLLLKLLAEGYNVTALSFDYGQKHKVELERATELVKYINSTLIKVEGVTDKLKKDLQELHGLDAATLVEKVKQENGPVKHQVVKLDGLGQLLNSTLVEGGSDVPEGHYAAENMKETVVPNRNKIFSSIIQAVALSIADKNNTECAIAMGIHAGDHCFSKNTELLTPTGLKTIDNLNEGDEIYSYNLETNIWELDKVTAIIKKNVVEKINVISTNAGNIELTDEHKLFRLKLGDFHSVHGYTKSIEKVKVSELSSDDYLIQPTNLINKQKTNITNTFDLLSLAQEISSKYEGGLILNEEDGYIWLGGDSDKYKSNKIPRFVDTKSFVNILAWYLAEGWSKKDPYSVKGTSSRYTAQFCQSLKANLDKVDLINKTISEGGFKIKQEFSSKMHNKIPKEVTYYVSNILSIFMKECGACSEEKHIPDWLMNILLNNLHLREEFLYTMGIADGFNTESLYKGFCSKSETLIKQMITLIQLSGYHFTKNKKNSAVQYITYSKLGQKTASISLGEAKFVKINSITTKEYNDHVYDITVEKNHNFCAGEYGSVLVSNSIYPDCRQEFRDADFEAFKQGNWGSEKVIIYTPYLHTDKFGILEDGVQCCEKLGLDFNEVYKRTNTSYKPIFIPRPKDEIITELNIKVGEKYKVDYKEPNFTWQLHQDASAWNVQTGKWYSDYKSASSVERILAFNSLGRKDPVEYADESGLVSWEVVLQHALKIEEDFRKDSTVR